MTLRELCHSRPSGSRSLTLTIAVKMTFPPNVEGFRFELTTTVVAARVTVWVTAALVLSMK